MAEEKIITESTIVPSLASNHYYLFNKDFDQVACGEVMAFILERNFMEKNRPEAIRLIINSQGGDLASAFALTDVMAASIIPVWTYGLGSLLSAALTTFIAGAKGHRYITKNTSILSHQFSWYNEGKEHELIATVKEIDLTRGRLLDHYKKHTRQSEAVIKKYLLPAGDVWLTAKEAIKYGLADKIIENW